jgi:hypothetical protein
VSDAEQARPALHIVRGNPTPEEIAALTAVVTVAAAASDDSLGSAAARGRWSDPALTHRRPLLPGPGAWRSAHR